MPYCIECGKIIPMEVRMNNNGICTECVEKEKGLDVKIKICSAQLSNLQKCAFCQTMTSVRCKECHKPVCQNHLKAYEGEILCPDCKSENMSIRCCIASVVLTIFLLISIAGMGH